VAEIKIEGINVKKGIAMTGGITKHYMLTLATFHKDGTEKIDEINRSLEANNQKLYTTYVHAIKSTAATIGAMQLSEFAKELEAAGMRGDWKFIRRHNESFLAGLQALLNDIGVVLAVSEEANPKQPLDFELLKNELNKLEKALTDLDSNTIDEAVGNLQEFMREGEIGVSVEKILQSVLIGEYDEALLEIKKKSEAK
jgi:HPt (histidine-containing phosphotransfer) domain-containing protein